MRCFQQKSLLCVHITPLSRDAASRRLCFPHGPGHAWSMVVLWWTRRARHRTAPSR